MAQLGFQLHVRLVFTSPIRHPRRLGFDVPDGLGFPFRVFLKQRQLAPNLPQPAGQQQHMILAGFYHQLMTEHGHCHTQACVAVARKLGVGSG
jgi:hypothetical protein